MTNLANLREKLERATKGPWIVQPDLQIWSEDSPVAEPICGPWGDDAVDVTSGHRVLVHHWGTVATQVAYHNAALIVAAVNALPHLLDLLDAKEAREREMREALRVSEAAMREYYRYFTGGETRGSYDGKPERNALWAAMYAARLALSAGAGADA